MPARLRTAAAVLFVLVSLALTSCGQQGSASQATPTPTATPGPAHYLATPDDNAWSFTFTVDPAGTEVNALMANLPSTLLCGGGVQFYDANGAPYAPQSTFLGPWPITNGQFTIIETDDAHGIRYHIDGTLNQGEGGATGTWSIGGSNWGCSGSWTAAPA